MNRVVRGEAMLAKLGARLGLTQEGREWLVGALDPFHDVPLDICGLPDGSIDPVITQIIKQSVNISCPTAITSGTWDCLIFMPPFEKIIKVFNSAKLNGTNSNPNNELYVTSGSPGINIGGLTYMSAPSGSSFNPNAGSITVSVPNPIADQYLQGNARVIGKGFEVHNTTSMLNIQGSVTNWTIPMDSLEGAHYTITSIGGAGVGGADFLQIPMWPVSLANAILTPGARQWEAKDGCYIVPRLNTVDIPVTGTGYAVQPFINGGDSSSGTLNVSTISTLSNFGTNLYNYPNVFWDNFDMHGSIFTGLSLQTTLTVNYIFIVERHPDVTISDLVVLARPPPERDEVALALYTHISRNLPVGVPVGENGLGDWFMDALSSAADYIAPALSAIPGPLSLVGKGVGALNSAYKGFKGQYETNATVKPPTVSRAKPKSSVVIEEIVESKSKGKRKRIRKRVRKPPTAPILTATQAAAFRRVAGRNALGGRA